MIAAQGVSLQYGGRVLFNGWPMRDSTSRGKLNVDTSILRKGTVTD